MSFWRGLRQFFVEKGLEIVFLALFIPLLLGALTVLLKDRWDVYLLLSFVVVALYLVLSYAMWRRERRKTQPDLGMAGALNVPRRGVVFTISPNSANPASVVSFVWDRIKPDFVGFLGTPLTEDAGTVKRLRAALGLEEGRYKSEFWDPTEVSEGTVKAGLVIDWMVRQGVSERDLVVDLTGGTATMSVAAFMAAQARRVDCQYVQSEFDRVNNVRIQNSEKAILITSYGQPAVIPPGEEPRGQVLEQRRLEGAAEPGADMIARSDGSTPGAGETNLPASDLHG